MFELRGPPMLVLFFIVLLFTTVLCDAPGACFKS